MSLFLSHLIQRRIAVPCYASILPRPLEAHLNSGTFRYEFWREREFRLLAVTYSTHFFSLNHDQSPNRLPPHPLHSQPAYTPYHPGGPFVGVIHSPASLTFLLRSLKRYVRFIFSLYRSLMHEFTAQRCSRYSQKY
jgi:hypothetical protein